MAADPASVKILAIHAHPDDIEIQCAGTLLKLKELGCKFLDIKLVKVSLK